MRGVLGLAGVVAVLVALVLAMRSSLDHTRIPAASHDPRQSVSQTAAFSVGAAKIQDSATFEPVESNGQLRGLKVVRVVKGGIADTHFGLLPGDVVTQVGPFEMGDTTLTDFPTARDWITEAYHRKNLSIVVERNGEEMTLPISDAGDIPVVASGGADGSSNPADKSPQITNPGGDE